MIDSKREQQKDIKYTIQLDRNEWCAVDSNFINLQESIAGFGSTPVEALKRLLEQKPDFDPLDYIVIGEPITDEDFAEKMKPS